MTPDEFFMRYAYPCSHNLMALDLVSESDYAKFEKMVSGGKPLPRDFAERIFHAAFRRIRETAQKMKINGVWDMRVLTQYWHAEHNRYIGAGDGNYGRQPKMFCDLCKVYIAEIREKKQTEGKTFFVVQYPYEGSTQTRIVLADQLPEAGVGDKIRIHSGYAVEFAE